MNEVPEVWRRAVEAARRKGHDVRWDAVSVARWTCETCGRAVLANEGVIYGSAVERRCSPDGK